MRARDTIHSSRKNGTAQTSSKSVILMFWGGGGINGKRLWKLSLLRFLHKTSHAQNEGVISVPIDNFKGQHKRSGLKKVFPFALMMSQADTCHQATGFNTTWCFVAATVGVCWCVCVPLVPVAMSATFWKASRKAPVIAMVVLRQDKQKDTRFTTIYYQTKDPTASPCFLIMGPCRAFLIWSPTVQTNECQ